MNEQNTAKQLVALNKAIFFRWSGIEYLNYATKEIERETREIASNMLSSRKIRKGDLEDLKTLLKEVITQAQVAILELEEAEEVLDN